jgi:hypothetical protein
MNYRLRPLAVLALLAGAAPSSGDLRSRERSLQHSISADSGRIAAYRLGGLPISKPVWRASNPAARFSARFCRRAPPPRSRSFTTPAADSSGGAPITVGGEYGFFPAPVTNYSVGEEPVIAARLTALGKALHLHLIGLSGYRTPQHSVEVGGFADDPHTRGEASDTPGVEGVPESTLLQFGLTRPFPPCVCPASTSTSRRASPRMSVPRLARPLPCSTG